MKVIEKIFVIFYMTALLAAGTSYCLKIFGGDESDMTPSTGRNLRAEARYHFTKANEAMDKMFQAEEDDDVDAYENYMKEMREEDLKLIDTSNRYEQLRDYLEAMIWQGKLVIKGFDLLYQKGTWSSILDHLTFRVRH